MRPFAKFALTSGFSSAGRRCIGLVVRSPSLGIGGPDLHRVFLESVDGT